MKIIYVGAGTFWLIEAIYKKVKGVTEVTPGYMGGEVANPTTEIVATGSTGHAEVVKIMYDEQTVTIEQLLHIFFKLHDPATAQHAGHGIGSQYRSVIFYTEDADGESANDQNGEHMGVIQRVVAEVQETMPVGITVSTQVMTAQEFYAAEEYHFDFFNQNPEALYSMEVIAPKLQEIHTAFPDAVIL